MTDDEALWRFPAQSLISRNEAAALAHIRQQPWHTLVVALAPSQPPQATFGPSHRLYLPLSEGFTLSNESLEVFVG